MDEYAKLSINQITTRDQWSLAEAITGYGRHGIHAISVWRDKLLELGIREGARMLSDAGMTVTGYCVGGLLSARDDAVFQERLEDNRRMIEEASTIGAECLVLIAGGIEEGTRDIDGARERAKEGLALLLPDARAAGIIIGLEPLHPMVCSLRSVLTTLEMANDWCEELGAGDELGIAVDVYNVWWDPNLAREIARAGNRICAFHVSDWLADTRDLRFDRGMMGDGVIDIEKIREMVETAGYAGYSEVEIFSERNWWRKNPDDVVETVKDR
ncbi:MAG TPA: sugar phosphate isomerase/epimerase, partial [Rhodospirillales bacterium]|nr:sugar phosphate isomerase/epimerase [Rhodospirillales bacterium]